MYRNLTDIEKLGSCLTSAEACEKSSWWLWKESCVGTGENARKHMCITNHPNMALAVKVVLTHYQMTNFTLLQISSEIREILQDVKVFACGGR